VGAPVGKEGDASELYSIADLSSVWVELAVPLADLAAFKEQQRVTVKHDQQTGEAKIVFISPVVNAETRSARVIAALDNPGLTWRPGTFVAAEVAVDQEQVGIRVPRTAVQTIEGKTVVFVRSPRGFVKREVSVGRGDGESVEIALGLAAGEAIAVSNTFLLKADLCKSEAEHSH
jgi:cobalt-zinc-cadmium efflux system membrane fusion protein